PFEPRMVVMESGRIIYDGQGGDKETRGQGDKETGKRGDKETRIQGDGETVVEVTDLHVGYNGGSVLHGLSLEIGQGEFVAVMGDNGSGKTTFLQSLLGLLKPDQRRVEVLGQDTRHTPISQLARQVGFLFQNPDHQLFAESIWKEATFALRNFDALNELSRTRTKELLTHCGLQDRGRDHPYRLSYGEKRRLNLISALAHAPRLILLDEVLIGQDARNATFLMELLRERAEQGGTVVMVNHNPEITRRYASRLIFFNSGQAIVDAPTGEAFRQLDALGRRAYLPRERRRGQITL
ncbi:MAG: ABC transporter ATP-binding protein, partial [Chloroflexota bacterium]|nr:ABC transporter ATP-binding protein [Chloroflexota bacterium]